MHKGLCVIHPDQSIAPPDEGVNVKTAYFAESGLPVLKAVYIIMKKLCFLFVCAAEMIDFCIGL